MYNASGPLQDSFQFLWRGRFSNVQHIEGGLICLLRDFKITAEACGGGTGSGLGCLMLERLSPDSGVSGFALSFSS